ncbi:MAG: hypothetical protein JW936_03325 [Sedimentisphaerales bacterium]|nr:hypothetical protein [Sedimentisphaerales bacterium]
MAAYKSRGKSDNIVIAGILSWLIPGGGYFYLGHTRRGGIACVGICVLFFLGVALGGIGSVGPNYHKLWFLAQILSGLPAIIGTLLEHYKMSVGTGRGIDLGQLYTGVAGLLNLLCLLDVLHRCQNDGAAEAVVSKKGRN